MRDTASKHQNAEVVAVIISARWPFCCNFFSFSIFHPLHGVKPINQTVVLQLSSCTFWWVSVAPAGKGPPLSLQACSCWPLYWAFFTVFPIFIPAGDKRCGQTITCSIFRKEVLVDNIEVYFSRARTDLLRWLLSRGRRSVKAVGSKFWFLAVILHSFSGAEFLTAAEDTAD